MPMRDKVKATHNTTSTIKPYLIEPTMLQGG